MRIISKKIIKNLAPYIIAVLVMLTIASCGGNGAGAGNNIPTDHLSLGERFLLELEYEQALFHFLALIEIEPMNPRGYTGAAQAHIGLGQLDEAIAILQLGLEVLPDNADILEMLIKIYDYSSIDDETAMQPWYLLTDEQRDMLKRLEIAAENLDYRTARAIMSSRAFSEIFYQLDFYEFAPGSFYIFVRWDSQGVLNINHNNRDGLYSWSLEFNGTLLSYHTYRDSVPWHMQIECVNRDVLITYNELGILHYQLYTL